jgi:(p)ppGpp synthase/HD superfamily hydrolase
MLVSNTARADAIGFVIDAYDGVVPHPGKGPPHGQAVADILRDTGADTPTQLVGLLHDVVEDTPRTVDDVRRRFGAQIAEMVDALTEDGDIARDEHRKRALRSKIAAAGPPVVDVAVADKIATLRHARITGARPSPRKLRHYRQTLSVALAAGATPELCRQLQDLLDDASGGGHWRASRRGAKTRS